MQAVHSTAHMAKMEKPITTLAGKPGIKKEGAGAYHIRVASAPSLTYTYYVKKSRK